MRTYTNGSVIFKGACNKTVDFAFSSKTVVDTVSQFFDIKYFNNLNLKNIRDHPYIM